MNSIKSHTETHLLCRAKVVVLAPMKAALDYSLPNDTLLKVGDHVWVPLGSQRLRGIISEICLESESLEFELKSIISRIDDPSVPENSLKAWLWAASWTLTPPGTFLKGCLQALKANKAQTRFGFVATDLPKINSSPNSLV
jgi:primosomal protein N' (replication factor Y) (superfamily II helicase)